MHTKHLLALVALAATSSAFAQQQPQPPHQPRPATLEARPDHGPAPVTRDEFLKRAGEHFDRLDVNKDGKLTPDERRAGQKYLEVHPARGPEQGPGAHEPHAQVPPPGK